ncbi:MAG: hypothetical protein ACJ757_04425 [Gaiellaceae bacterium]
MLIVDDDDAARLILSLVLEGADSIRHCAVIATDRRSSRLRAHNL